MPSEKDSLSGHGYRVRAYISISRKNSTGARERMVKRLTEQEMNLQAELRVMNTKLKELEDRYRKQKTLADSVVEKILEA